MAWTPPDKEEAAFTPPDKPTEGGVTWEDASQHIGKRLGLGASAAGMGGLPPDVRMEGQHVLGVGAAAGLGALAIPGTVGAIGTALASPWVGAATGGVEGYRRGGVLGAAKGAVEGAATSYLGGGIKKLAELGGLAKTAQAIKAVNDAATVKGVAEAAKIAKGAEAVADVSKVAKAAKTAEEAKAAFDASKAATREFAKANSSKLGEKVWMLLDDAGKPLKTLTPDQAGAAARKGLATTWVKNTWSS